MTDLHVKYRPKTLAEVRGQDAVVKSLTRLLANRKQAPHTYLFTGASGVGKTTLARIVGHTLRIPTTNVIEVDGATYTGIDSAKEIKSLISVHALGSDRRKMLILDECHRLSTAAWDSWLKLVEEPPSHLYLAFCTTVPQKLPRTLHTRCHAYTLSDVREDDLYELLVSVAKHESIGLADNVLEFLSQHANGSPRQALVYLSQCGTGCRLSEAKKIIRKSDENSLDSPEAAIARMLIAGNENWAQYMQTLKKLTEVEPESIRIVTMNYVAAVMRNQPNPKRAARYAAVLEAFQHPYNQSDKFAPLLLSLATLLL